MLATGFHCDEKTDIDTRKLVYECCNLMNFYSL